MAYSKTCKYCDLVKITWDDKEGKYIEVESKQTHTKERCQEAKAKGGDGLHVYATKPYHPDQEQKANDIKAAQKERLRQHNELIKNMQWLTMVLAKNIENNDGATSASILDSIGFEQNRESQLEERMD